LRPAVAFWAFVPPRDDAEREVLVVDRDLVVPDVDRALLVPEVDRALLVVDRDLVVPDVDRDFAAVARPPLLPAAFFCAVVPPRLVVARALLVVDRDLVVPDVDRDFAAVARPPVLPAAFFFAVVPPRLEVARARVVPEADRDRLVVDRDLVVPDVDRDFAAVALPPLRPAAFFCAVVPPRLDVDRDVPVVERLRLVVERDVLREVPDFARAPDRVVPEVERDFVLPVDRRGVAALTREMASSVTASSPSLSPPKRSGINPGVLTGSGVKLSPLDSDSSRLSPSK
jgi:hypothetical protein